MHALRGNIQSFTRPSMATSLILLLCVLGTAQLVNGYPTRAGCSIAVNGGLPSPQPLLLKPGGSANGFGFYLPSSSTKLVILTAGSSIRLSCPGSSNFLKPLGSSVREATAVCVSGTTFTVNGVTRNFRDLACNANAVHVAKASGAKCYDGKSIVIDIGFEVGQDFIKTVTICFDESKRNTLYSTFDLVAGIGGYQSGTNSPSFVADNFYPGLSVDNLYTRNTQRQTISKLLGSSALGDKYIHASDDYFLSRGHLAAKADFVYESQHRATYHFVNVAPQWQTFNGGNWNVMEQDVRALASSRSLDLKVYSGTHGVTTLPDVTNKEIELYLSVDSTGKRALPVPKLYWKVVYNPKTEQGIALVGVNNPYIPIDKLGNGYRICTDVCSKVSWLKWKPQDVKMGFAYCCDVNELRETIDTLPPFHVSGLLT